MTGVLALTTETFASESSDELTIGTSKSMVDLFSLDYAFLN